MTAPGEGIREILFEFTIVGSAVKVVAIDPVSGLEVSVMGPAQASRADMQRLAAGKLKQRLVSASKG